MEVIELDGQLEEFKDGKTLFNIKDEADIIDFSREELALIKIIRLTLSYSEGEDFIEEARENGDITYTKLKLIPKELIIPEGYEELYNTTFKKRYEDNLEELSSEDGYYKEHKEDIEPHSKRNAHYTAYEAVEIQRLKDRLLENPYLIYTLSARDRYLLQLAEARDREWVQRLIQKNASIVSKLNFVLLDKNTAKTIIERDYKAFKYLLEDGDGGEEEQYIEGYEDQGYFYENKDFLLFIIEQKKQQGWTFEDNCYILQTAKKFNNNREVVEAACAACGREFMFASKELRADKDFILYLLDKGYYDIIVGISLELDTSSSKSLKKQ